LRTIRDDSLKRHPPWQAAFTSRGVAWEDDRHIEVVDGIQGLVSVVEVCPQSPIPRVIHAFGKKVNENVAERQVLRKRWRELEMETRNTHAMNNAMTVEIVETLVRKSASTGTRYTR
jgi:hypothetical protein